MARDCYRTGKYCDAVAHAKESIALLKSPPFDAKKFARQADDLIEMAELCARSLCKLDRPQEALVECDLAIGHFNVCVSCIFDLQGHGSDLDEEELDKVEQLGMSGAIHLSQLFSKMKKETGAELPPDYDSGVRIQRNHGIATRLAASSRKNPGTRRLHTKIHSRNAERIVKYLQQSWRLGM